MELLVRFIHQFMWGKLGHGLLHALLLWLRQARVHQQVHGLGQGQVGEGCGFCFSVFILNIDSVPGEKFREEPALGVRVSDLAQFLFINHSSLRVAAFCQSLWSSSLWSGLTRLIISFKCWTSLAISPEQFYRFEFRILSPIVLGKLEDLDC